MLNDAYETRPALDPMDMAVKKTLGNLRSYRIHTPEKKAKRKINK